MKFEFYQDADKQYRWRLLDDKGRLIAVGEPRNLRALCMRDIYVVMDTTRETKVEFP